VDNVKAAYVALTMRDDTHTTHVASTSDHDGITGIKLYKASDLALVDIELDRVIDLNGRVRVANRAAVVGYNVRDTTRTDCHLFHLAEFVARLLGRDAVDCEAALDIVQKTKVFTRLFDRDHVYAPRLGGTSFNGEGRTLVANREGVICANLSIDFYETLGGDRSHFTAS